MNLRIVKRLALGILLVGSAILATTVQTGGLHGPLSASASTRDFLYVGDVAGNAVDRFDTQTGHGGVFVQPGSCGNPPGDLCTPHGMIYNGNLLVANGNDSLPFASDVFQFHHLSGKSLGAIIPYANPNAPWDADGLILGPDEQTLYVPDAGNPNSSTGEIGRVATYNRETGQFLGNLDFSSFIKDPTENTTGEFHPRGVVFGPDGLLYLSLFSENSFPGPEGWILSYNLKTRAVKLVSMWNPNATDCSRDLHRPDGLVFGPDGKLYVASFRANSADASNYYDRILVYTIGSNGTGTCSVTDEIPLDQGQPRAFAQYLLFGPGGKLFVPIAGGGPDTGAVREYDVSTKIFTNFVQPNALGGPVAAGWGLTFGLTNPTTLAYGR